MADLFFYIFIVINKIFSSAQTCFISREPEYKADRALESSNAKIVSSAKIYLLRN